MIFFFFFYFILWPYTDINLEYGLFLYYSKINLYSQTQKAPCLGLTGGITGRCPFRVGILERTNDICKVGKPY